MKRTEKQSSQDWKPKRAALAKVRAQNKRFNTRVYVNSELRQAWFPSLGYVGNFVLKSSHKHFQIDCVHVMVLIIFVFPVSESSVVIVTMRTGYSVLRGYSDKGQLFVARFGAVQCHSGKGQFSNVLDMRLYISRVDSVLVEQWPFVKTSFQNF